MISLAEYQALFLRSVRYQETPTELLHVVRGGGTLTPLRAVDVYRQMYWYRLVDAHFALFPALAVWMGKARFTRLVSACIAQHPSHTPVLERLARPFASFAREALEPESVSFDLCAIEAAVLHGLLAPDPSSPPLASMHTQRPDFADLKVRTAPSLSVVEASQRAMTHFERYAQEEPTDDGRMGAAGYASPAERERSHYVFVRPSLYVRHAKISSREADLLLRAHTGVSVGDVLVALKAEHGNVRAVFERLVAWMELGILLVEES